MGKERRIAERQGTCGLLTSIWDGKSVCIGVVDDVSATGIRVSQIPTFFDSTAEKYLTTVHGPQGDIKMMIRPSWKNETRKEMYFSVGFQILKPTYNWKQFITESMDTWA